MLQNLSPLTPMLSARQTQQEHQIMNLNASPPRDQVFSRTLPPWPFWLVVGMSFLIRYLSVALHEAGHWAVLTIFGRGPVMGFTGLVQRWGTPPQEPGGWVRITFSGSEGWLRLASSPSSTAEWVLYLGAGLTATVILAWIGCVLLYRDVSPTLRAVGLILALVNGLGVLLFPLNYFLSSGDTAFIAYYLHISEALVAIPYELLRGGALIAALAALATWRARFRWAAPALLGYFLMMPVIFTLNHLARTGVEKGTPLFTPLAGWSAPVLVLDLVALGTFIIVYRKLKPDNATGQSRNK